MLKDAYDLSFYEFDEEKDPKEYGVLLCDVVHGRPPMKPAYIGIGWYWYYHGIRYAAGNLSLPTTHGWDSRFVNGYPYITAIKTTEEEAKAREPVFREKIKPFLENFDGVWDPLKLDLLATYKAARESRGLKEWDDIKKLSNHELLSFFLDFVFVINRKEGETHFYMLMAAYYISGLFQEMWRTMFGVEPGIDPTFHRLMSGFEASDIIFTRGLWQLGRKAVEAGLEDLFKKNEDEDVLEALKASEAGRKWSDAYHEYLLEHGWRADRMHAYDYPTWLEKPSIGIARIKFMMWEPVFPFDVNRERVNRERQEGEKEILTKIPEAQRDCLRPSHEGCPEIGLLERGPRLLLRPLRGGHGPVAPLRVRQTLRASRMHRRRRGYPLPASERSAEGRDTDGKNQSPPLCGAPKKTA